MREEGAERMELNRGGLPLAWRAGKCRLEQRRCPDMLVFTSLRATSLFCNRINPPSPVKGVRPLGKSLQRCKEIQGHFDLELRNIRQRRIWNDFHAFVLYVHILDSF